MPSIVEIVTEYLTAHGYDGLCNAAIDCACLVDDLMPCDSPERQCQAGYRVPCPPECGEHEFHIQAGRETDATTDR